MENFPLNKYKFIITDNQVIAISTYGGKTVKGIAKVNPADKMDVDFGKKLAAARCNAKVAKKRCKRGAEKFSVAQDNLIHARDFYYRMMEYYCDSNEAYIKAKDEVKKLIDSMN